MGGRKDNGHKTYVLVHSWHWIVAQCRVDRLYRIHASPDGDADRAVAGNVDLSADCPPGYGNIGATDGTRHRYRASYRHRHTHTDRAAHLHAHGSADRHGDRDTHGDTNPNAGIHHHTAWGIARPYR